MGWETTQLRARQITMRSILYGIFFGAAATYLYVTQSPLIDSTTAALMTWRDGARQSVYGYSGPRR